MITKSDIKESLDEALKLYNQKELAKMLGITESSLTRLKTPTKAVERFLNLMNIINLEVKDIKKVGK